MRNIIAAQMDRQQRRSRADDILENDGDLQHLHQSVDALHQQYLEMSQTFSPKENRS